MGAWVDAFLKDLFQSTPPRGRRPDNAALLKVSSSFQSTPPRGRRRCMLDTFKFCFYFNPRLRKGGDDSLTGNEAGTMLFQSTPPQGRRRHSRRNDCLHIDFNPRLRKGGDHELLKGQFQFHRVFQSTPPQGRRLH